MKLVIHTAEKVLPSQTLLIRAWWDQRLQENYSNRNASLGNAVRNGNFTCHGLTVTELEKCTRAKNLKPDTNFQKKLSAAMFIIDQFFVPKIKQNTQR